jgi:hypothetical protein
MTNTPGQAEAPEHQKSKHQPHPTKGTETPGQAEAPERHTPANRKGRKEERKKDRESKIAPHGNKRHTKRPNPQGGQTPKRKTQHQPSAEAAEGP